MDILGVKVVQSPANHWILAAHPNYSAATAATASPAALVSR